MNNRFEEAIDELEVAIETTRGAATQPARTRGARRSVSAPRPDVEHESLISAELAADLYRAVVPMTIRFRPQIATAMKRVVLENRLRGEKPDSLQDAMNEAAVNWVLARQKGE